MRWLGAAVLLFALGADAGNETDARLASGAAHFRAGRFDQALVEFKVARELGARGEVAWYIAAALTKLERSDDAIEAFINAIAEAPKSGDALLAYYYAMACYDAHLLVCADQVLARVGADAGPRIAAQAAKVRGQLAAVLSAEPPRAAIDALLVRGESTLKAGRRALARAYFTEALALSHRRADRHRSDEASARRSATAPEAVAGEKRK